ncbi:MAG: hypothetical protein WBC51_15490 [Vicinamibacterales bacterium]
MLRLTIALLLLAGPTSAFAQEIFSPSDSDLRIGQKVRVLVDGTCAAAPCPSLLVKGKIAELASASLVVDEGPSQQELAAATIQFVERPRDRIWNGVLVGFAVGLSIGFVSVLADGCSPGEWCLFDGPSFAAAVGLLGGGIGAGVGAVTDAAISNHRVIFTRTAVPATNSSQGTASARGFSVRVRF